MARRLDLSLSPEDEARLLAYDWLRIIIWFDHMGLRVATLVNLTFLGGDRADERSAHFVGHRARTRAIPDVIEAARAHPADFAASPVEATR